MMWTATNDQSTTVYAERGSTTEALLATPSPAGRPGVAHGGRRLNIYGWNSGMWTYDLTYANGTPLWTRRARADSVDGGTYRAWEQHAHDDDGVVNFGQFAAPSASYPWPVTIVAADVSPVPQPGLWSQLSWRKVSDLIPTRVLAGTQVSGGYLYCQGDTRRPVDFSYSGWTSGAGQYGLLYLPAGSAAIAVLSEMNSETTNTWIDDVGCFAHGISQLPAAEIHILPFDQAPPPAITVPFAILNGAVSEDGRTLGFLGGVISWENLGNDNGTPRGCSIQRMNLKTHEVTTVAAEPASGCWTESVFFAP